jgi:CubicO group peptidase (beta-lactamase class C family)
VLPLAATLAALPVARGAAGVWTPAGGASYGGWGDVTPDTVVELGSVAKCVTGLLLAAGVAAGEVSPDDPLRRFLPRTGRAGDATLGALATHTAGLPRLSLRPCRRAAVTHRDPAFVDTSVERLVSYARWARVRPAGLPAYSNLGGALLGQALAAAAGADYWALAAHRVLGPLGMDRSGDVADAGTWKAGPLWAMGAFGPSGGLRGPLVDLLALATAAAAPDRTPLAALFADALTPRVTSGEDQIGWLWHLRDTPYGAVTWHNGATGAASAMFAAHPRGAAAAVIGEAARNDVERSVFAAVESLAAGGAPG